MFEKYQSIWARPLNPLILGDLETGFPPKLEGQGGFSDILLQMGLRFNQLLLADALPINRIQIGI